MVPSLFEVFKLDIAMFFILVVCVYAMVKTSDGMIKAIPDSWGDWFILKPIKNWFIFGLPAEVLRWLSFGYGFLVCWVFNFKMITNMFLAYNKSRAMTITGFWNYIIVACLLFTFSKLLYKMIEGFVERHGRHKE